jgi:hypothetical protein
MAMSDFGLPRLSRGVAVERPVLQAPVMPPPERKVIPHNFHHDLVAGYEGCGTHSVYFWCVCDWEATYSSEVRLAEVKLAHDVWVAERVEQ